MYGMRGRMVRWWSRKCTDIRAVDEDAGERSVRHVLRFGAKLKGSDVPSVPARYRSIEGPSGRLVSVLLRTETDAAWLRLRHGVMKRELRVYPLGSNQPPTPTPDTLELRGAMRVYCHDGYIGQLEGVAVDSETGQIIDLLVQVRGDILSDVERITSPLARLINVTNQQLLLPPAWATTVKSEERQAIFGGGTALHLDASAEQVAVSPILRSDAQILGDVLAILEINPAVGPYVAGLEVTVRDGDVTISGKLPTPRHRASAEQDIWHVAGVFAVHNNLIVADA